MAARVSSDGLRALFISLPWFRDLGAVGATARVAPRHGQVRDQEATLLLSALYLGRPCPAMGRPTC